MDRWTAYLEAPVGWLEISGGEGAEEILFLEQPPSDTKSAQDTLPQQIILELKEYFEGERKVFRMPVTIYGSQFQQEVCQALRSISHGETLSYRELARMVGGSNYVRAVAAACARNPLPIVVPCHRVVGTDGSLTGYAGGLERKEWLLKHEARNSGKNYQGKLF